MSVPDALRLVPSRIVGGKAPPFDPLIPNRETIAAMQEARQGKLPRFDSTDGLMRDLHAED